MLSKCEVTQRTSGGKVEITLPDGNMYRISFDDKENLIRVNTVDGGMIIRPYVSNEIRISTDTN
jgi:hypothetical protein